MMRNFQNQARRATVFLNRLQGVLRKAVSRGPVMLKDRCDKNVIVFGSNRFKSSTNGSTLGRCIWLRNIVESRIFRTRQNNHMVSGTRRFPVWFRTSRANGSCWSFIGVIGDRTATPSCGASKSIYRGSPSETCDWSPSASIRWR